MQNLMVKVVLLLVVVGCAGPAGDYRNLGLVNAVGVVQLDGAPLPGAVVTFDAADGQFSYGLTDADGKFALQIDSQMKGVTPGDKVVRISTTRQILGLNAQEGDDGSESGSTGKATEKVPDKYNKESELTVTVSPGKTQYDFQLSSK